MASQPPDKSDRDANLDELQKAVDEWFDSEKTRLENESKFLRAVLEDRGAKNVAQKNLATASALLQSEVDDFIG